jgi:DNA excision repair protein ERCC-4
MSEPLIPVLCDSREQRPWTFNNSVFSVEVVGLKAADYSLKGMASRVGVERKSLADFLGSITSGRERFHRELERLRSYEHAALIIEASWSDIELGNYPLVHGKPCSAVHPNSVAGTLVSIHTRYVPVLLAGDRAGGQSLCARLLRRWWLDSQSAKEEAA